MATWLTLEQVREAWTDAPLDDDDLTRLLESAQDQIEAYLPADWSLTPSVEQALLLQARALWRSIEAGDNDGIGPDGFTVTVFPMDWTVKNLLRPKNPRPRVA